MPVKGGSVPPSRSTRYCSGVSSFRHSSSVFSSFSIDPPFRGSIPRVAGRCPMPELPDVEGFRRYMARHATGKRITGVRVRSPAILRNTNPQGLSRAVKGRVLTKPNRHGKWLSAPVGRTTLILHFGMTGGFQWTSHPRTEGRFDRMVLEFADGELRYHNMRMLGGVWTLRREDEVEQVTGKLGPDAAAVGADEFEEMLNGRRGGIKAALMNQRMIAGIGNELSDEILWQGRGPPTPGGCNPWPPQPRR